jgi:5-methylcytosine-specific restriction endonuclease McrA
MARDYRKEYRRDHASPKAKKDRAARNGARRKLGLKKGDGMEVDHVKPLSKGGGNGKGNLRAVKRKTNRRKAASWSSKKSKVK